MAVKALIIGCGNIGALYDLHDAGKVWTHTRAFSKMKGIEFSIADINEKVLKKVSKQYKVQPVTLSDGFDYSAFDIVSITSPTKTHYSFLRDLMKQNIPVIICEKPVAASSEELAILLRIYKESKSKVLVNYIRRFQPAYYHFKKRLLALLKKESCTAVIIKYQRGFLNNCSHAIDLLEFLFDKEIHFKNFGIHSVAYDAFEYDPTITATFDFDGVPVSAAGITGAEYPVFEIELFFKRQKIVICHSGDEIRYYVSSKKGSQLSESKTLRQKGILKQYMLPVVKTALNLLKERKARDNFIQAAELNGRMIDLLSFVPK